MGVAFLHGVESTQWKREQNQQGVKSGILTLPERESLHLLNSFTYTLYFRQFIQGGF